jgi:hypothetical protein
VTGAIYYDTIYSELRYSNGSSWESVNQLQLDLVYQPFQLNNFAQHIIQNTASFDTSKIKSIAISGCGRYQLAGLVTDGSTFTTNLLQISSDYGSTWSAVTGIPSDTYGNSFGSESSISMSSSGKYQMVVDTNNDRFLVSSDYGNSFTEVSLVYDGANPLTSSYTKLCMSADGKFQYILPQYNVAFLSTDYGSTWNSIEYGNFDIPFNFAIACSHNGKYLSLAQGDGKIYKSSDYGGSWSSNGSPTNLGSYSLANCMAMSGSGQYRMAIYTDDGNSAKNYCSDDYGDSWTSPFSSSSFSTGPNTGCMSASGQYQIATNGQYIYYSVDYGNSFSTTTTSIPNPVYAIAMSYSGEYITFGSYICRNSISNGILRFRAQVD